MDKLSIRLEAIKLAVEFRSQPEDVIEVAKNFEKYIIGEADVPEFNDPFISIFNNYNDALKNNEKQLKEIEDRLKNMNLECCHDKSCEDLFLQANDEKVE